MKTNRQTRIIELISKYPINRQEQLVEYLKADGYDVTQSTISRDIKKLNLTKVMMPDGITRYQQPQVNAKGAKATFTQLFSNSALFIDVAKNILVIKTSVGMANAICASLDLLDEYDKIIGTVAGDDTIICICKDDIDAQKYLVELNKLIR